MKKKLLLILLMLTFITNVSALTFNVDVTNIEEEGTGTLGTITSIDVPNKSLDVLFEDIGAEVNFSITITNTGDRAGTLREITFEPGNDKIEYTSNLPDGGLAINGNDTNKVIIKAKVKEGATNGSTTSQVKIKYTYDEGSCPDGEILSDDESMCLCPEGMERNENGICVKPEKPVECAEDEIYNSEKKICEKKVIPVDPDDSVDPKPTPVDPDKPTPKPIPSNPKTLDNIVLITLLFMVSGLGIYAVLFKKLKTFKQKRNIGIITGVITLSLSFTVLAGVFGLDNLLSAIVNPITKTKELVITVNEEIDLIETWDGTCSQTDLTPENIFEGGSGTESDPYQIKTAEQLSCFAKSVNGGEHYQGKYIKQIKNIKLNNNLNAQAEEGTLNNANAWIPIGYDYEFSGTYDGDNHTISGLYFNLVEDEYGYPLSRYGLFGSISDSTIKNLVISDVYLDVFAEDSNSIIAPLFAGGSGNITVKNIKTYGSLKGFDNSNDAILTGVFADLYGDNVIVENVENNVNIEGYIISGVANRIQGSTIDVKNVTNNGVLTSKPNDSGGIDRIGGIAETLSGNGVVENVSNKGTLNLLDSTTDFSYTSGHVGGLFAIVEGDITFKDSYNTGDINLSIGFETVGGLIGETANAIEVKNCYNSGNITYDGVIADGSVDWNNFYDIEYSTSLGGLLGRSWDVVISDSFNSGNLTVASAYTGGLTGSSSGRIENSYNIGDFVASGENVGGLVGVGAVDVYKSYNEGDFTIWCGFHYDEGASNIAGLIADASNLESTIDNSYNTGDITFLSQMDESNNTLSGLCTSCTSITNSYNRGDITSVYVETTIQGISRYSNFVENVYNSGNISANNLYDEYVDYYSPYDYNGISYDVAEMKNAYNLGNITIQDVLGVNSYGIENNYFADETSVDNCVNVGDVTVILTKNLLGACRFNLGGISPYNINSYNAGNVLIDDSALDHPISEDVFDGNWHHEISVDDTISDSIPDILDIINGDGAFNDTLDESGLPTLKVFNE